MLAINEIMADNTRTIEDPDETGEYPDWIELVNLGPIPCSLNGIALSDDPTDATPWRIDAPIDLDPGEHILIWADNDPEQGPLHADFKLDRDGEQVLLYDVDGRILDHVTFGPLGPDSSYARIPDATGSWRTTDTPTPGGMNTAP